MTEDTPGHVTPNLPAIIFNLEARLLAIETSHSSSIAGMAPLPIAVAAIHARLDAMDKATTLLHEDYTTVPTELDRRASQLEQVFDAKVGFLDRVLVSLQAFAETRDKAIDRATNDLRTHMMERFSAVDLRFTERDLRFSQSAADHQKAIDAALVSVTNYSERSERAFTKQMDGLSLAANKNLEGLGERIDDLKERMLLKEGSTSGMSSMTGWIVGGIMTVTAVVTTMVALYNVAHVSLPH